jgi:hypothetical protein
VEGLPLDGAGGGEHLFGAGPYADVFREVFPAYCAGTIHQKLGGAGDVVLFGASGFVQQVVAANHLGIWVGKKGESVALLLPQMFRDVGPVYADGHGPDALCGKLGKIFLDAS